MSECTGYVKVRNTTGWIPVRCVKVASCWSSGWEHLTPEEIAKRGLTRGEESSQAVLRERASWSQRDDPIETGLEASLGQAEQRIEELNEENAQLRQQVAGRVRRDAPVESEVKIEQLSTHDPRCRALNPETPTWCDCTALSRETAHVAAGNHELAAAERVAIAVEHTMFMDSQECRDGEYCRCPDGHPLIAGCDECCDPGWPCEYVMAATRAALNGYKP